MSLLSGAQLAAIQNLGKLGMTTSVTIYPITTDLDNEYGSQTVRSTTGTTVIGWLVGRWATNRGPDVGDVDTTTLYRLRLPVGTQIEAGWDIEVDGHAYHVIDAGTDQTWPEWLNCTLNRSK